VLASVNRGLELADVGKHLLEKVSRLVVQGPGGFQFAVKLREQRAQPILIHCLP
jgi:hypothetical protein